MKNLKIKLGIFNLLAILAVSVFMTSCEQEIIQVDKPDSYIEENHDAAVMQTRGIYQKEIVLKDKSRKNEITLKISCDDKEILDLHNSSTLRVEPTFIENSANDDQINLGGENVLSDSPDVHIELIGKKLEKDAAGFNLYIEVPDTKISSRGWYSGGPYNFYSWVAPHSFYVKPKNNSNCVSAWFYYTPNQANSWQYCWGGCGGYYLCNYAASVYWNNNNYDTRLKAQGNNFYVSWY